MKIFLNLYINKYMSLELEKYRYEKKFVIENRFNFLINNYVKSNPLMFAKQFNNRTIDTIYFDNDNLDLYKQNIDGLNERKKIRIRWYPNTSNFVTPILEIKIKKGNLGEKIRYLLEPISKDSTNFAQNILNSILKVKFESKLNELIYSFKPILLVSYDREYFLSRISKCRLTVDKNIKFYKISANKINNNYRRYKNTLIELKYPSNLENLNLQGISDFPFRFSKHSKYVEGIYMTN